MLLDVLMPGPSGFEVCEQLKADVKTADIPVIFLTALSDIEDEQLGLELGAVDYITKPISPAILLARVKNHLKIKAASDFLKDKNYQANIRLDLILNATGEGIYGIGINGDCVFINTVALNILGYDSEQEILGKNNHQLFHFAHPDGSPYILQQCPIYKALQGEASSLMDTEVFWRKDGTSLSVQYQSHPIKNNEKIIGCVVSFMDITERKQNEALLLATLQRAETLAKSKAQFLANMSHEIRTPMNGIIGFSELALLKDMPADIRDYLQKINSTSLNLLNILNDILDLSKLEAGNIHINLAHFAIDGLIDVLDSLFIETSRQKGLNLTLNIAPDVPCYLLGDRLRLEQVLINLVGNAIKFTASGSVTLNITLQQRQQSQARLLFSVTDTGIGISATDQDKLFQPFSQIDESITRRFGGTGLGLALSHDLVQLMGGELSLISEFDQGSCFSFELILAISSLSSQDGVPDALESLDSVLQKLGQQLTGFRILVVEDNVFNQQIIQEFLNLSGISVNIANNGQEALLALENTEFDAVLMDIHMPVMDGFEATRQIRSFPRFLTLPIIALTAGVTEEERGQYLAAGMDDFISKPINPVQLLSILAHWLKLTDIPVMALGTIPLQEDVEKDQLTAVNPDMVLTEPSLPVKAVSVTDNLPPAMDRDMCVLRELVGDDPATLTKFLGFFHVSALKISADIITAITTGQAIAASNAAHTLSTSAHSVGALRLGDLCLQIEEAGNAGDNNINAILRGLLPGFEEEWDRVEKYLLAWPDEPIYTVELDKQ
ncbi:response regulator [Methylobacter sp. S3L5C]|uniref:response regulator n=1 Tax=Methylobacter sp. S3L5C TaxID=2839024 RepID=UPI0027391768|nr:response regulator [Methylobacter sp. S3L5C]